MLIGEGLAQSCIPAPPYWRLRHSFADDALKRDIRIPSSTQSLKALQTQGFFRYIWSWELVHKRRDRIKKGVAKPLSNFGSAPAASGRDGRYGAAIVCAVANPEEHRQMLTNSFISWGIARRNHCAVMDGRHEADVVRAVANPENPPNPL